MAIKETIIYQRPNTSVLWLYQWHQTLPDPESKSPVTVYGDYFSLDTSESVDKLTLEVTRLWNNKSKFIESRSALADPQLDLEYFNYLLDNKFVVTRVIEQV